MSTKKYYRFTYRVVDNHTVDDFQSMTIRATDRESLQLWWEDYRAEFGYGEITAVRELLWIGH